MDDEVTTAIVVDDGHLSGRGRTTTLRLSWRESDPLAVHLTITAVPDHPSLLRGDWVILRDFLRYGIDEPTGDGEVRISPVPGGRIRLDLSRDCGDYWVTIPIPVLQDFLDATDALVPAGEERSGAAIDALIERLLGRE